VLPVSVALAADSTFVGADAAGQAFEEPVSHLAASLGGAFTSGNTRTYTLNATLRGDHRWKANKVGAPLRLWEHEVSLGSKGPRRSLPVARGGAGVTPAW
jgi:hypothetical protein